MFRHFQTKLVVIFVALVALVQLVTIFAVYNVTSHNVVKQIKNQLVEARSTFNNNLSDQADKLMENARVMAHDFALRKVIAAGDRATSLSAISNHGARIEADRVMLISLDNAIIADTHRPLNNNIQDYPFPQMIERAIVSDKAVAILVMDNTLYRFALVPVLAPIPIAWIGVGVQIDHAMVSRLKDLFPLALDISFLMLDENNGWRTMSSTLAPKSKVNLPDVIVSILDRRKLPETDKGAVSPETVFHPQIVSVANEDYVTLISPVTTVENSPRIAALLQYPLAVALSPYQSLLFWLTSLSVFGLFVTSIGSMAIARGVTKPVRTLAEAARRIKNGEYQQPVDLEQKDELGQLASTFNMMMKGIAEREEKIGYQLNYDTLTGLPNRHSFERELELQIKKYNQSGEQLSVVLVNIDRLPEINNTLGYHVGDHLVREVSKRFQLIMKNSNMLARLSSNSFIMLIDNVSEQDSQSIAKNILMHFEQTFDIEGINIDVHVQIGISCFPQHGKSSDLLIQRADVAMYMARKAGSHYAIYDMEKDTFNKNRLSLMSDLIEGLSRDEFQLYYQPKIDIDTGKATHVEALMRWIHPVHGFMPPDEFIPAAEQTGHIQKLTCFALEQAVSQCSAWQQSGINLEVAVNISAKDLSNDKLPMIIQKLLLSYQIEANNLILEITESALMQDPEAALAVLLTLREMGLQISIDDFGTGHSSLVYLKDLPVDILKIDRSFVMDLSNNLDDAIIVQTIIQLAHNLGLKVVAEGVEDQLALEILSSFDCDLVQGYYFSKPLPVDELNQWFDESRWGLGLNYESDSKGIKAS
jgi:diguanylate cyclase (GGDEF)-like protein